MAMVSVSSPDFGHNDAGYYPYLIERGWSAAYGERPFGASDAPSCDETISAGLGFCLAWGCGRHPTGHVIGKYHLGGGPVVCAPRGPGMFSRFNELFGPQGLESFEKESRDRTDRCRAMGTESAIYLGGVSADAFTPQTAEKLVQRMLDRWCDPIIRAGFDWFMGDAFPATEQLPGAPTPSMRLAEHLLYRGVKVAVETVELVTPTSFPWFNGRFGIVDLPGTREVRSGPGWFSKSCQGVNTRRFYWLQGSIPPVERLTMLQEELNSVDPATPVVDFGGAWPANPTSPAGTPSHTPSCPTAPSPSGLPDAFPAGPQ